MANVNKVIANISLLQRCMKQREPISKRLNWHSFELHQTLSNQGRDSGERAT
jgi:hypothetical protein